MWHMYRSREGGEVDGEEVRKGKIIRGGGRVERVSEYY